MIQVARHVISLKRWPLRNNRKSSHVYVIEVEEGTVAYKNESEY